MKAAIKFAEAFAICFLIGVVVLLGAATLLHTFFDKPEYRADLTRPPIALMCPDNAGHCQ